MQHAHDASHCTHSMHSQPHTHQLQCTTRSARPCHLHNSRQAMRDIHIFADASSYSLPPLSATCAQPAHTSLLHRCQGAGVLPPGVVQRARARRGDRADDSVAVQ